MQEKKYETITHSKYFSTNWNTNIESSLHSKEKRARGVRIIRQLLPSDKPVLNAGSNVGYHSMLSSRLGFSVVSLDPSVEALKRGVELGWIDTPVCGDVMHLPFRSGSFGNAIFSEVIEEIPDQKAAVVELARCSKRLIITTSPIKSDVFYDVVKKVKQLLGKDATEFAHINEMHPDALFLILRNENLVIRKVSFHNPFHIWNIAALFPPLTILDLSPLDVFLGDKRVSSAILCVAETRQMTD